MNIEIFENGFFDERYIDRELPDDFFDMAAAHFAEDPVVKYAKKKEVIGAQNGGDGVAASPFHLFDYDASAILMGPDDVIPPLYHIEHDEEVVEPVLAWYEAFHELGSMAIFPEVEIAQPLVPPNKLEKSKCMTIQRFLLERGYVLCNPTYSEVTELSQYGDMASDHPYTADELDFSALSEDRKRFYPYVDYQDNKYQVVTMQFNPYHPMSLGWIKSIERINEFVVSGEYIQNGRIYTFYYDLRDVRFRVHSDQWMSLIGSDESSYEVFDLVGNFDFLSDFYYVETLTKICHSVNNGYYERELKIKRKIFARKSIVQPFFVEPFNTARKPPPGYSVIGPWPGLLSTGVADFFYSPFMTPQMEFMTEGDNYRDVTSESEIVNNELYIRGRSYPLANTQQFYVKIYSQSLKKEGKLENGSLDIGGFQVFERDDNGPQKFIRFPNRVYSYPYNGVESIIFPMRFISIISVFALDKFEIIKELMPLSVLVKKKMFSPKIVSQPVEDNEIVDPIDVIDSIRMRTRRRYFLCGYVTDEQFYEFLTYCEDRRMSGNLYKKKKYFSGELEMCSKQDIEKYEHFIREELVVQNKDLEGHIFVKV